MSSRGLDVTDGDNRRKKPAMAAMAEVANVAETAADAAPAGPQDEGKRMF